MDQFDSELSFVVGPRRNWLNLWKQTIDALDPCWVVPGQIGHGIPRRPNQRAGLHCTVDQYVGEQGRGGHLRIGRIRECYRGQFVDVPQSPVDEFIDVVPADALAGVDHHTRAHEFRDDDVGYLAWLAANPEGFAVNIARNYSVSAARVHHATCRTISGQNPHNGPWTGAYVKVCAIIRRTPKRAANTVRKPIPSCGTCLPDT